MNSSWISLYAGEGERLHDEEGPFGSLLSRGQAFRIMEGGARFDLVVFGCGLSGVGVAREAALLGAQVLLIDPGYPGAHACSWRESIVREMCRSPWSLVRSARSLRHAVQSLAPHLAVARRCDLSGCRGVGARLALRSLRTIASSLSKGGSVADIPDIEERSLIRELALAARQEGVFVVGATSPAYVERDVVSGTFRVAVRDLLSDQQVVVQGGGLFVDPTFTHPLASRIGTPITRLAQEGPPHLIVVCSVRERGELEVVRYFDLSNGSIGVVCELRPGVVEVSLLDVGMMADASSVGDIVRQLCEASGYVFVDEISRRRAGRRYGTRVAVENRRGILVPQESSPWKIETVLGRTMRFIESDGSERRVRRELPGEWRSGEREEFIEMARRAGVSESTISLVIERWRGRVRYLSEIERSCEEVCPGVLRGEIALAVISDQVASLEDLLFGSLGLHTIPGWRAMVAPIAAALAETGAVASETLDLERVSAAMLAG
jgi:hypothetical protein